MDSQLENSFFSYQGNQFIIVPIRTDKHRSEVLSFMQTQFRVQEPITNALKCSAQDTLLFYKDICSSCFKYDVSLIAQDHIGQLVGISLNSLWEGNKEISPQNLKLVENKESNQAIRNGPYPGNNANRLFVFLEMVESDLNSILNDERVLKLEIISVHPLFLRQEIFSYINSFSILSMGIASNLIKRSIEIANFIGCSHVITCATAVASQNLFKKFGFKSVHKVLYEDFLEEGVPVFRNLHDNGRGAELMLYKLK